ncbi:LLM class flavin-dependent oxidoreductase [Nostoc sp. 'Lobaria pulmonaria (5183) cyanobiont']|uniref:LLM class flavin-dependent oxidoreductase n=1 Tax=Nostoc sp. 'Lobaria pulmonaria (5183) cyanobiont' TaxID=1618022 RepID=UPI000CF34A69|nr:LLM class flavin-dependent oxidoreductase [Nostoc sp. 'Lobaria pulmonaria (5183) cyanobiont']AVH69213.1 luciferase-like monooxygenase [Nostoc sp. 'Lobaria pulmonaria (5183) cyanobiont']
MEFSLFYFSGDGSKIESNKYNLLIESAKFADKNNFSAVWTPERHFHAFGGLYPSPSLTCTALAMVTKQIQLRAGSVVMPLHNPARVAEEWSVVDNLSNGRVAIGFASGWTIDDFVLSTESHANRKETMWRGIQTVQKLWEGEQVELKDATGKSFNVKTFPRPIQPKLPTWIVCQSSATFIEAGKIGANILTSLLGATLEEVAPQISLYRQSLEQHGYDPNAGKVAMMIHTFLGEDFDTIKEAAREPFYNYLKTHIELLENLAKNAGINVDLKKFTEADMNSLLRFAYEGWLKGRTLIGSKTTCMEMIERLKNAGVDEVACLIDFNDNFDDVMTSLPYLKDLKNMCNLEKEKMMSLS